MVKKIIFSILIFFVSLNANIYESNCVSCHKKFPVTIDKYFYRYLLKYSSESNVKNAMLEYMKNPTKDKTIMPEAFILRFGIKKPSNLSNKQLKEALDIYWNEYKVFGKLK
ncbi:hypothetical protein [Malaciobacter marinus]|uniref:hypothetical protein n=1 Tax=Malaciobacter marinus TaxID=505249 RepID=UPI003B00C445